MNGPNDDYEIQRNKHGVFVRAGPRTTGPHKNVWDHWETGPTTMRLPGPATCRCEDCGLEWLEGQKVIPRFEECV